MYTVVTDSVTRGSAKRVGCSQSQLSVAVPLLNEQASKQANRSLFSSTSYVSPTKRSANLRLRRESHEYLRSLLRLFPCGLATVRVLSLLAMKVSKRRWRSGDRGRAPSFLYLFTGVLSLTFHGRASHLSLSFEIRAYMLRLVPPALFFHLAILGQSQPHVRFFSYLGRALMESDRVDGGARTSFYSVVCAPCLKLVNKQSPPSRLDRSGPPDRYCPIILRLAFRPPIPALFGNPGACMAE